MRPSRGLLSILATLVAMACGGGSSSEELGRAVMEVVLSLPSDSLCALVLVEDKEAGCTEILVHPGLGREYYSVAQTEARTWSTSEQLPSAALEGRPRYRFMSFEMRGLKSGQLGYAAHIQEPHAADSVGLLVEIFAAGAAEDPLLLSAFAIGKRAGGRWTFDLRDIAG